MRVKGVKLRVICVLIIGILNVGKLMFINWLVKKNIVKMGDRSGIMIF